MLVGPIFVREAMTAPRRFRHYLARSAYGALLLITVWTAWQQIVGFQQVQSAGDMARFGSIVFWILSFGQISLALFFAPIVAGSSISAEKDRRTLMLLLMTDLTNWEIVIGKLLGSLLQMGVLLAAALPIFALCLFLGGASPGQVAWVFAVTAAAALASGSLGILVASWRDKTFQTLALTVLILVLYLVGLHYLLGEEKVLGIPGTEWRTMLSPFSALFAVLDPIGTGVSATRQELAWAAASLGLPSSAAPQLGFMAAMLVVTASLVAVAIATLRIWNPGGGKPAHAREGLEEIERRHAAEALAQPKLEPRSIWDNPVLWREIRTRAYGHRPLIVKLAYFLVFSIIAVGFGLAARNDPRMAQLGIARTLVPVLFLVTSLVLINVQAVTAITSERDGRALDLLLVTDITPKEFIFGKIWGVLYNTKEMIVLPVLGLCALLTYGYLNLETWGYIVLGLFVLVLFATTLGLHASLAYEKTRSAVVNSLGTVVFLFLGVAFCIYLIRFSTHFAGQFANFVVFLCAGSVGLYLSLAVRNQSTALALVAFSCPWGTFWAIVQVLQAGDPLGAFLVIASSYLFAVLAMLVPAVSEFDVALGRTVADEG